MKSVGLLDPIRQKLTAILWQDGKRISQLTGVEIPVPRRDYSNYVEGRYDTKEAQVKAVTFQPDIRSPPVPDDCVL